MGQLWDDSPLTANGHNRARDKGKYLSNDGFNPLNIYTSPYSRTLATATEIKNTFIGSKIMIEPLLSEFQPRYQHKINLYPNGIPNIFNGKETNFSYPENYDNFGERVKFIIFNLIKQSSNDILIVTHGEVLKKFINYLQNEYPDIVVDPHDTPYLTTLSLKYDTENHKIDPSTIHIE
jgi:broad specificity phosphatase PhoE